MFNFFKRKSEPDQQKIVDFKAITADSFFSNVSKENITPKDSEISYILQNINRNFSSARRINQSFQFNASGTANANSLFSYQIPTFQQGYTVGVNYTEIFYGEIEGYIVPTTITGTPNQIGFLTWNYTKTTVTGQIIYRWTSGLGSLPINVPAVFPGYYSNTQLIVRDAEKFLASGIELNIDLPLASAFDCVVFVKIEGFAISTAKN